MQLIPYRLSQFWHNQIVCRIRPRNKWASDAIPHTWCDKVELIPKFLYAAIIHFVDGEKCFEKIDYESDATHEKFAAELKECYYWVKYGRADYVKLIEAHYPPMESVWMDLSEKGLWLDQKYSCNADGSPLWSEEQVKIAYGIINRLETKIAEIDSRWMKWIIDNRQMLWV